MVHVTRTRKLRKTTNEKGTQPSPQNRIKYRKTGEKMTEENEGKNHLRSKRFCTAREVIEK